MSQKKVLVVEDETDIRETIQEALELYDIPVVAASTGQEGLDILSRSTDVGLILLDLMMPGMDGTEFMEKRPSFSRVSDIPVVLVSANREVDLSGIRLKAHGFLKKPVDLNDLIETVKANLDQVSEPVYQSL